MVGALNVERKKRVAVWLVLMSVSLMVVVVSARYHPWVTFAGLGVELTAVVLLAREAGLMQKRK